MSEAREPLVRVIFNVLDHTQDRYILRSLAYALLEEKKLTRSLYYIKRVEGSSREAFLTVDGFEHIVRAAVALTTLRERKSNSSKARKR